MMQPEQHYSAIKAIGQSMGPAVLAQCCAIFEDEQHALAERQPAILTNAAYGPDERHRLDLYRKGNATGLPVVLFVHGGGFVLGDKGDNGSWQNANAGRMAAQAGMLGAVMNYRLAPDHPWPAGSEDVGYALDWLQAHVADHGGDRERIFLMGTSAGAVHVSGLAGLRRDLKTQVAGLILLSGLYGYTPLDEKDLRYYAEGTADQDREPRQSLLASGIPMLLACAENDPTRFQMEFLGLEADCVERYGRMPRSHIASGHNHYSIALHLGSSDRRLEDAINRFIFDTIAG
jgi:acetyl esterase/lipase